MKPRRSPLEDRLLPRLRLAGETHGRRLSSEVGASPGAVARALNRMEQRGLVRSRFAGRTRLYRAGPDRGLLEDARTRLLSVAGLNPLAILPFGSRIDGTAGPDSDLDLLVILPDGRNDNAAWQRLRRSLRDLSVPIDLLVYSVTEARRWADVPGTPVNAAIQSNLGTPALEALGL